MYGKRIQKKVDTCICITESRGKTAEVRRTTILWPVERKSHSQKNRQNEKAENFAPDEGTR